MRFASHEVKESLIEATRGEIRASFAGFRSREQREYRGDIDAGSGGGRRQKSLDDDPRRFRQWFHKRWLSLSVVCSVALWFTGCSQNDPGLQERLVRLQAELDEANHKLQAAEAALEKAKPDTPVASTTPAASPSAVAASQSSSPLPKAKLQDTCAAGASDLAKQLGGDYNGYALLKYTLADVKMPTEVFPYTSTVSYVFRSNTGSERVLEVPVGADASGKWHFPQPSEVVAQLGNSRPPNTQVAAAPTPRAVPSATPAPVVQNLGGNPGTGPDANAPVTVIQWGKGASLGGVGGSMGGSLGAGPSPPAAAPTGAPAPTYAPAPAPTPAQAAAPPQPSRAPGAAPMPADKEVTIHF